MDQEVKAVFARVTGGGDLTREQARRTFERIMTGEVSQPLMGALFGALLTKGESVEELVGAAEAMRARVTRIACPADAIDTCGTGGDGISTYNVSTTAAIIAAAGGATVAKHGNRSTTRICGSTEVLAELGIDVEAPRQAVELSLATIGIGYLNARMLHPAMHYAAAVRQAIPSRTIFNLLGPLTNPAGVRRQIVGVPRPELVPLMAGALSQLGAVHAWVVHGADGLCDLSVTSKTTVVEVLDGRLRTLAIEPEDVAIRRGTLSDLMIDSPQAGAKAVLQILDGEQGPRRGHALLNAGAALVVAGVAPDLRAGVDRASQAVDSGAAKAKLAQWREIAGLPADGAKPGKAEP